MERINLDIEESAILDAFEADILQTSQNAVQEMDIARAAARIVPKGWTAATISDLAAIIMGQSPSSDTYNEQKIGLPFFQGKAEFTELHPTIKKWCSSPKKVALPEDILLSVRAPVGAVNIANVKCCIGRGLAAIRYKQCNKFLYYFFKHIEKQLDEKGTGSTFRAVSGDVVQNYPILTPPLNEQKRIVAKIEELFSELDNGITALKTARKQLKVYRQAVLKHAFEGKLTAQWRKDNADKLESPEQLLARIQNERETRYQQQLDEWKQALEDWKWLGKQGKSPPRPKQPKRFDGNYLITDWLPKTWARVPLEVLISFGPTNGWSPKATVEVTGTKAITLTATTSGKFDGTQFKYIDASIPRHSSLWLKRNDILVQRGNTIEYVGVPAIYTGMDNEFIYPDLMMKIQTVASVSELYLVNVMSTHTSRNFLRERAVGAAGSMPKINQQTLSSLPIPICSDNEQKKIIQILDEIISVTDSSIQDIELQLSKAETLRQSILKKAFSGQLVPQDPNDEPVSDLLARIQAEKAEKNRKGTKR